MLGITGVINFALIVITFKTSFSLLNKSLTEQKSVPTSSFPFPMLRTGWLFLALSSQWLFRNFSFCWPLFLCFGFTIFKCFYPLNLYCQKMFKFATYNVFVPIYSALWISVWQRKETQVLCTSMYNENIWDPPVETNRIHFRLCSQIY